VIGNNKYVSLPSLETAVNDAKAVGEVLRNKYGFDVTTVLNASRYEILTQMNKMREKLTEKDNLVIYYAGHGELDRKNQRGHWLPVDAEADNDANWISNVKITDILNAMNAKHVLVVSDSCYSGALTRSSLSRIKGGLSERRRLHLLQVMAGARSRTALTSGGLQPVLDAGGGGNSIFAKALLSVLRDNGGVLEGQDLHRKVAERVAYEASQVRFEQQPLYAPIQHAGHEGSGEFLFVPARLLSGA
jgi:uncharacterized caspase-like protein